MGPELQPAAVTRASYPPRLRNGVDVFIDGEEAFGRIYGVVEAAQRSVWITVSFAQIEVRLPGRDDTFLDVVTRTADRGVDVRLLFWWSEYPGIGSFRGDEHELALLRERGCRAKMRWDAIPRGCHHQKTYVVDSDTAFVGGINLTPECRSSSAHRETGFHDLFAELRGPAVTDVARNFVQRWNQATVTRSQGHAYPSLAEADDLPEEMSDSAPGGETPVQVVRSLRSGLYRGIEGWVAEERFDLHGGEDALRLSVLAAVAAARERIYFENQFLMDPDTIDALTAASERGVEIIGVVPLEPDPNLLLYPEDKLRETRAALARLSGRRNVGLFGLAHEDDAGRAIYVHAKLLIADDSLLQLGSANLWPPSYVRDSELNVVVWDAALAERTRRRLWDEHLLGNSAGGLDEWRRLAAAVAGPAGRATRPPARVVAVDPAHYYVFPDGAVAPWQAVRAS